MESIGEPETQMTWSWVQVEIWEEDDKLSRTTEINVLAVVG